MRVLRLEAQNIMRLSAVSFDWDRDQPVMTIGGLNGAGKSSVVNAIAMALGGEKMCPAEPIRQGEAAAFVEVDFDDLIVRRDFYRETIGAPPNAEVVTRSKLVVRNREKITQGTPQKLLDRFISKLTFDPLAFMDMDPKVQDEVLRKIAAVDVSEFESKRLNASTLRSSLNRDLQESVTRLQGLKHWDSTPAAEISMAEVTSELDAANNARTAAEQAAAKVAKLDGEIEQQLKRVEDDEVSIADLESRIAKIRAEMQVRFNRIEHINLDRAAAVTLRDELQRAVPDVAEVKLRLEEVEAINKRVRDNKAVAAEQLVVARKKMALDEQDAIVEAMVAAKKQALAEAKLPVPGLELTEQGIKFNGVPFKQASTADQIKTTVAIGFAMNPGLKLLMVKNGNALDENSMKLVAEEAAKAGGQILMEYVTKDASEVSVFIEDGHVA